GLGRRSDRGADRSFSAVSSEGDGRTGERADELHLGRKRGRRFKREQGGDGNSHESMQGVPDEVEGRNFVGEELDGEERETSTDDPPTGNKMQGTGQRQCAGAGE